MDYYQSNRPPADESGLSGGVSFNYGGKVAVQKVDTSSIGYNYAQDQIGGAVGGSYPWLTDSGSEPYDVSVGVGATVNNIDISITGEVTISFSSGHVVTVSDPGANATWQEIQVCDGGVTKTMKVLATAPV